MHTPAGALKSARRGVRYRASDMLEGVHLHRMGGGIYIGMGCQKMNGG
ncbi:MAG: hypothetical protein ABSE06_16215 [Anaerolineaceae bacterium]